VSYSVKPFRRKELDLVFNDLVAAHADIRHMRPADPDTFHPFQVFGDSLLRDVAARPVPPYAWSGRIGWINKSLFQTVSGALGHIRTCNDRQSDHECQCNNYFTCACHDSTLKFGYR